jgi:hypothetical protein
MRSSPHTIVKEKAGFLDHRINMLTGCMLCLLVVLVLWCTWGYLTRLMDSGLDADGVVSSDDWFDSYHVIIMYFLLFNGLIAQTLHFSLDFVRR